MLVGLKNFVKYFVYKFVPPPYSNKSFSQAGEDCCVDFLFSQVRNYKPTYLELGVCNPIANSNTYKFYDRGSSGVLVEADKSQIEKIKKERPRDKILNIGVGFDDRFEADFYIFEEHGHNTFDKAEAEYREKNGSYKLCSVEKVKLININNILSENFEAVPDFLSIDIEGLDFAVLKSLNLIKYPIPVICAETCTYSEIHIKPKDKSIENYMLQNGYFVYADTYINTIFVNEEWFNTIQKLK